MSARVWQGACVPLWIGAVGHRLLRPTDDELLRRAVREVLEDVEENWVGSLEPRLLSSLAEGADSLVAEEARARGWKLAAVLPLPMDSYERDFTTYAARERFRRLVKESTICIEVGRECGVAADDVDVPGHARDRQYERAAACIVRACQIVVALWDGEPAASRTANAVERVLGREPGRLGSRALDAPAPRLLYHVWTPTIDRADITRTPGSWTIRTPGSDADRERMITLSRQMLARLTEFDAEARALCAHTPGRVGKSEDLLLPLEDRSDLPGPVREALRGYALADALAADEARLMRPALPVLLLLGWTGFLGFQLLVHHATPWPWFAGLFFGAFLLGAFSYRWFRRAAHERRFLDYRALAEGLRVQVFWALCGLPDRVVDHYLRRHGGELSWIPVAVAAFDVGACSLGLADWGEQWPLGRRRRLARERWLESEARFFAGRAARADRDARRWSRIHWAALLASFLGVGCIAYLVHERSRYDAFAVVTGVLLYGASLIRNFSERRAYEAITRRYHLMHAVFARAASAVGDSRAELESAESASVFRALGEESLAENGDWLLLRRDRPLEIPTPG